MNSVRQSCRPKHQVLILKCYPRFQKGMQSVKANSSELSYLLYYASTRRSKLQKVGDFLEKRAARDVWRGKIGNVQVTLQILSALIEKVPRDLPLYARSVLTILDTILQSHEISIVEESVPTFETFCRHQDMATLSADRGYLALYRNVVQAYANFASADSQAISASPLGRPLALRWKNIGLQAIKSTVDSESLSMDGSRLLEIVMPVILQNLYASGDPTLSPLHKKAQSLEKQEREQQARRRRMSIATAHTVDTVDGSGGTASGTTADADKAAETEARVLALRCLEKIFAPGSNRGQTHTAARLVLDFFIAGPKRCTRPKTDRKWATDLLEMIVNWTPVQDRFIILVTLVEKLVERPLASEQLESQLKLASLIDWLLSSPINLIGLSVLDGLIELLQFLLALLRQESQPSGEGSPPSGTRASQGQQLQGKDSVPGHEVANEKETETETKNEKRHDDPSSLRRELVELLQKCIGGLATHIYYADQVSDMTRNVISRLRPSTSPEGSSDEIVPVESANTKQSPQSRDTYFSFPAARVSALQTIKNILVVANPRKSISGTGPDSRNRVPIQVWEGTPWLLRDPEKEVRHAYVDAFITWLQLETDPSDLKAKPDSSMQSKTAANRYMSDSADAVTRRVASLAPQKDYTTAGAGSSLLQLFHLAVYEVVSEPTTAVKSDFLALHLVLVNLVENLGVNAARHGLPVIMKLQDDCLSNENNPYTPDQICNMGTLVHGYLWALVEMFDLEGTRVGKEIMDEISKRKNRGIWLDKVQIPPLPLSYIGPLVDSTVNQKKSLPSTVDAYCAFASVHELVSQIESAYVSSLGSPPPSPTTSPRRPLPTSSVARARSSSSSKPQPQLQQQRGPGLPMNVKEQMLSPWSKERCLANLETEKAKSSTGSGSRTAASGARNHLGAANGLKLGNGLPAPAAGSPTGQRRGRHVDRPASPAAGFSLGVPKIRRSSAAAAAAAATAAGEEERHSPTRDSSRDSTVKVNELRRVLSVVDSSAARRPSPLRKRTKAGSDISSAESMVTDTFTASEIDVSGAATAPDTQRSIHEESETPKASSTVQLDTDAHHDDRYDKPEATDYRNSNSIPPVPPLPSTLTIPGGFPPDAISVSSAGPSAGGASPSHSPIRSERPRTAPSGNAAAAAAATSPEAAPAANAQENPVAPATPGRNRSLTRRVFRPHTEDGPHFSTPRRTSKYKSTEPDRRSHPTRTLSLARRDDVEKLLEGLTLGASDSRASVQQGQSKLKSPMRESPSLARRARGPDINSLGLGVEDWSSRLSVNGSPSASRMASGTRTGIGPPPY